MKRFVLNIIPEIERRGIGRAAALLSVLNKHFLFLKGIALMKAGERKYVTEMWRDVDSSCDGKGSLSVMRRSWDRIKGVILQNVNTDVIHTGQLKI